MTKQELKNKVFALKDETRVALQLVYDTLNKGQQNKILKEEAIKAIFDRYGVAYTEQE